MKIVRQDADVLVLKAMSANGGTARPFIAIGLCMTIATMLAGAMVYGPWCEQFSTSTRLLIGLSLAVALLTVIYILCEMFPNVTCLAFDRTARRVLCVSNTLLRIQHDEVDFDHVRHVAVQSYATQIGTGWALRLTIRDDRGNRRFTSQIDQGSKSEMDALAATILETLGRVPTPESPSGDSATSQRFAWTVKFACAAGGILLAVMLGQDVFEKSQAPSWPKTDGVVEAVQISKKPCRNGKTSTPRDAIDIVYRYSIGGVEYHGTRFNLRNNWLFQDEVAAVQRHYRVGQACKVSYNPSDPAWCSLTTDVSPQQLLAGAALATASGLASAIWVAYNLWQIVTRATGTDRARPPTD